MIVKPKMRGFICTTAHPDGCRAHVHEWVEYSRSRPVTGGPKRVLVLGCSTGYGLASRIAAAFSCKANTIGVCFERPASDNRTATAGWYNNRAFEELARADGLTAYSLNMDAFSQEAKAETIAAIRENMPDGQVDLVIYSLAAPRRRDPVSEHVYNSVIKPIGSVYTSKTLDMHTGIVSEVSVSPANEQEISETVAVMGGEDWLLWMQALSDAGVLANSAGTLAYSYIGPALTHAVYKDGTIGKAKEDLEQKAILINRLLAPINGRAFVSVNKALVTQSSSAIPVVPLYVALLYKLMKQAGTHEGCIEQMVRLFADRLYPSGEFGNWDVVAVDEENRIRLDDWEMDSQIQADITALWQTLNTENAPTLTDLQGYCNDFYRLFGFRIQGINYEADVTAE